MVYAIAAFVLVVVIVGAVYLMLPKTSVAPTTPARQTAQPNQGTQTTQTKVTPSNVGQTLQNTDTTMQQAIDQANSDLNDISKINTSQDSTSGL